MVRARDAATGLELGTDIEHRHLGSRNGAEQHEFVEITPVAYAKQFTGDLGQAGAECEIVASRCAYCARLFRSINRRIIGVKMNCIARPI